MNPADHAHHWAAEAARRSGVTVAPLTGHAELLEAVQVLNEVWQSHPTDPVASYPLLRAYVFSGNYVVGAVRAGRVVAAAVGFLGAGNHLHSDLVGVLAAEQGTGVGFAIKQHQRAWAIERGLTGISWTFDPLLRRNARFNLHRLGATAGTYLPDFYGRLADGLNPVAESDRLAVDWLITSDRVAEAARRPPPEAELRDCAVVVDADGGLHDPGPAGVRLVAVPRDLENLERAAHWRTTVRAALTTGLADGFTVTDVTAAGQYVLSRVGTG